MRWRVAVDASQKRALRNTRARLGERGSARFEVLGRDADRDLVRSFARQIAEVTPEASELRATVSEAMEATKPGASTITANDAISL